MNIKYDMEMNEKFSGKLLYKKQEYFNEKNYFLELSFIGGEIYAVEMMGHSFYKGRGKPIPYKKELNPEKWNSTFWVKTPLYINCDDCRYNRVGIVKLRKPNMTQSQEDVIEIYV
ncbi:MAG: hypothetical protein BZ138_08200 [Methanosphaera sp. rholeuAM270]|nr:MAG: hypothetical protein BZ138_08200 [Methanosphaera sp. rholeuAM270]